MKLTKKAAALLLAASLAVSVCATPVFADDASATYSTTNPDATLTEMGTETHTEVIYKVCSGYSWSIPTSIDFGSNAGVGKTVKVNADDDHNGAADNQNHSEGTAQKVKVTSNTIPVGTSLKISIAAATPYDDTGAKTGFYVVQENQNNLTSEKLYYTIAKTKDGPALEHTDNIMKVESGKATDEQALYFALKTSEDEAEKAGKYTATLKFEAKVVDN